MNFSKIVKRLRNKLVLSQTEFGCLLNVSLATVCRWEHSKFEPTIKTKRRIIELCKKHNIAENSRKNK